MKKLLNYILLMISAMAIFAALVALAFYFITADLRETEKRDQEDPVYQQVVEEKKKEDAKKKEEEPIKKEDQKKKKTDIEDFEFSKKAQYTPEKLVEKIGDFEKYSSRVFKIGDEECIDFWYAGKKTDDDLYYDECNYYMFMDSDSAQKAFEYMKENWIQDETDSGKKYIRGWEAGVCDASVEIYIYITNNMIITTEVQVVSEWAVDSPDYAPPTNHYERVEFINKHF